MRILAIGSLRTGSHNTDLLQAAAVAPDGSTSSSTTG